MWLSNSHARGHRARRLRVPVAALLAISAPLVAHIPSAFACGSCRGPAGPGASITAPWQRVGAQVALSGRWTLGNFLEQSRYVALGQTAAGTSQVDAGKDLGLALGLRLLERLELQAVLGVGSTHIAVPGYARNAIGFSDTQLRARYDVLSEPGVRLPNRTTPPSLGVTLSLRLPTGSTGQNASSAQGGAQASVGSLATNQSLGTTEFALAFDVRKSLSDRVQIAGIVEGAVRAPDSSLGRARALGPRLLLRPLVLWFVSDWVTVAAFVDLGVEGAVRYDGMRAARTSAHVWSAGSSMTVKHDSGLRSGVSASFTPPLSGFGSNVATNLLIATFVGFAR